MTDAHTGAAGAGGGDAGSAGAQLRAARQAQGVSLDTLAGLVKVTPAKLQALEEGRYDALPDVAFTRALAKTLCRVLKIDDAPVLAQMPGALPGLKLERVDGGLNAPFRERASAADPAQWAPWRRPVPWLVGALLLAAAAFVLVPSPEGSGPWLPGAASAAGSDVGVPQAQPVPPEQGPASAPDAPEAADAVDAAAAPAIDSSAAPATAAPAAGASQPGALPVAASAPDGPRAVLRAVEDTWVQASDAGGQVLTSRLVPAGETVELVGKLPIKLRIGNVRGTELRFRDQLVDLRSGQRGNVANVTLN